MREKKYAAMAVIALVFLLAAIAYAEDNPTYLVEGIYNPETSVYTAEVYLSTSEYLSAGTFGMAFDDGIKPNWNSDKGGFLEVDTDNFDYLDFSYHQNEEFDLSNQSYMVVQWTLKETDVEKPVRGKIHLGTVTVEDVTPDERGVPNGWSSTPFHLLNWTATKMYTDEMFAWTDDETGLSMNDEIWRNIEEEEASELASQGLPVPDGYYKGYASDRETEETGYKYDFANWIDIDFEFTSNVQDNILISGMVHGYNCKNPVKVTAYKKDAATGILEIADTTEIAPEEYAIYKTGEVDGEYKIEIEEPGSYILKIEKSVHLTYFLNVNVPDYEKVVKMEETVYLYCGDINSDGHIKIPDRIGLIRFFNRQRSWESDTDKFDAADLNGDGRVNLYDLSILKQNMDKQYESEGA